MPPRAWRSGLEPAVRISSTRHEEARYNDSLFDSHFPENQKLIANLNRDRLAWVRPGHIAKRARIDPNATECHRGRRRGHTVV